LSARSCSQLAISSAQEKMFSRYEVEPTIIKLGQVTLQVRPGKFQRDWQNNWCRRKLTQQQFDDLMSRQKVKLEKGSWWINLALKFIVKLIKCYHFIITKLVFLSEKEDHNFCIELQQNSKDFFLYKITLVAYSHRKISCGCFNNSNYSLFCACVCNKW